MYEVRMLNIILPLRLNLPMHLMVNIKINVFTHKCHLSTIKKSPEQI